MSDNDHILITGATGFIGSHLVKDLVQSGKLVRCLVRNSPKIELLKDSGIEICKGDILKPETLEGICDGMDVIVHCAALGHVSSKSEKDFDEFNKVNIDGSLNLAKACSKAGVKKFIHLSSTAAMGLIKDEIATEKTNPKPITPYQKSKYIAEEKLREFSEREGLPLVILRPCMVYGPFDGGELLRWCRAMKKGFFPRIGFGKNLSPLIHIADLVTAIIAAIDIGKTGETYLLTSDESYDMNMIIDIMAEELGKKFVPRIPVSILLMLTYFIELSSTIFRFQPLVTIQNMRSMAADRLFDISKAKRDLGFSPSYPIEKGIRETVRFYRDNKLL